MDRFRVKSTRSHVSSINHYLDAVPEAAQRASVLPGMVSTLHHARRRAPKPLCRGSTSEARPEARNMLRR